MDICSEFGKLPPCSSTFNYHCYQAGQCCPQSQRIIRRWEQEPTLPLRPQVSHGLRQLSKQDPPLSPSLQGCRVVGERTVTLDSCCRSYYSNPSDTGGSRIFRQRNTQDRSHPPFPRSRVSQQPPHSLFMNSTPRTDFSIPTTSHLKLPICSSRHLTGRFSGSTPPLPLL
jgi:hypothetical protein